MTFIYKIVFPCVWISGFGIGTLGLFIINEPVKWKFLIALTIGTIFLGIFCFPLKYVKLENNQLVVSNYFKKVYVPLTEISEVTENVYINIHPVWIHFRIPTEFGYRIMFMPKTRISFLSSHPIVKELTELSRPEK